MGRRPHAALIRGHPQPRAARSGAAAGWGRFRYRGEGARTHRLTPATNESPGAAKLHLRRCWGWQTVLTRWSKNPAELEQPDSAAAQALRCRPLSRVRLRGPPGVIVQGGIAPGNPMVSTSPPDKRIMAGTQAKRVCGAVILSLRND